jgi:Histidine kinase-, DNA gyrase B-, and HSP90-like ATPase
VPRFEVQVDSDHLERLTRQPVRGLAELIWNAVDADAAHVSVDVERNPLGAIQTVIVRDDGTGISYQQAEMYFTHLGGSWKKLTAVTEAGRSLHGQAGQGRWAAYGVGDRIEWRSVAEQVTGERAEIVIVGRRDNLRVFDVTEPVTTKENAGTIVRVEDVGEQAARAFEQDFVVDQLTADFALYLEKYPVAIEWQGRKLDPAGIQHRREIVTYQVSGVGEPLELEIIEWSVPQERELHLCDSAGTSLHQTKPGIHAPGFDFTAYIKWDGFRDRMNELVLAELDMEPLGNILEGAKDELRRYFKRRTDERAAELITAWKTEASYPFPGEPTTLVERAERELFEVVAVSAAPAVQDSDVRGRRLSLRLIREAIERNPDSLHDVLREVLELPRDRLEELRALLQKTSLTAIITATRRITDRLDFLGSLEELVFNPELKSRVLERSQLHRIIANETWIFGEEYALTADDQSLRTALKHHIAELGRTDLAPKDVDEADVVDSDGRRVIVDMALSRVIEQRKNRREHLVIELKRPSVSIGIQQILQINRYARAVATDQRFSMIGVDWDFWIVGDELDDDAHDMAVQKGREPGVVSEPAELPITVRAVTWAQVIQNARHRLDFVRDALEYSATTEDAIKYLHNAHGKFIPVMRTREETDDPVV